VRRFFKNRKIVAVAGLLLVAVLLLWARHHLRSRFESARDAMIEAFAEQMGVTVEYDTVTRRGFSALVLTRLDIRLPDSPADQYFIRCARAEAEANLWALLRGKPALRTVAVFEPEVRLVLGKDGQLELPSGLRARPGRDAAERRLRLLPSAIELSVHNGTLTFVDERRDATLVLERVRGSFESGDRIGLRLRGSPADVPLGWISLATAEGDDGYSIEAGSLPGPFIDKWLLNSADLVRGGELDAKLSVRLAETGDLGVLGTVGFHSLEVKDMPAYLGPLTGTAHVDLTRYTANSTVSVRRVSVETDSVSAQVEGELVVTDGSPSGTITARITKYPFERLIEPVIADRLPQLALPRVRFNEGSMLTVRLRFPTGKRVPACRVESPGWRCSGTLAGAAFSLDFGNSTAEWDENGERFTADALLTTGTVQLARLDETIRLPKGTVDVEGGRVQFGGIECKALGGMVSMLGSVTLDDEPTIDLRFEAEQIDAVRFGKAIGASRLFTGGRCNVRGKVFGSPARPVVTGTLNVTDTELRWSPWFEKTAGVTGSAVARYDRNADPPSLVIESARLGDAELTGTLEFGSDHSVQQVTLDIDGDAPTDLAPLFHLPLDISGRGKTKFTVAYTRTEDARQVDLVATGIEMVAVPRGADSPVVTANDVRITIQPRGKTSPTDFDIYARDARIPETIAEMQSWLAAFRTPGSDSQYQSNVVVRADNIMCGRIDARNLYARLTISPQQIQWHNLTVAPYGGSVTAHHNLNRDSGDYVTDASWKEVSLREFLAWVMNGEPYVDGEFAGEINVKGESGSPDSREGTGYLEVVRGAIDPVFMAARFSGIETPETPAPIQFDRMYTSVRIEGNVIRTPDITIAKEGITFDASGYARLDGEVEYEVNIVLSPEVQDQIPLIRDKKIIPLPRFAQTDLPLRFKVERKAGELTSSVEDRRLSIRLLEDTFEMGSDVVGVGSDVVGVGSDVVKTGVKVLEWPAQLLYQVLQYLPKGRNNGSQ